MPRATAFWPKGPLPLSTSQRRRSRISKMRALASTRPRSQRQCEHRIGVAGRDMASTGTPDPTVCDSTRLQTFGDSRTDADPSCRPTGSCELPSRVWLHRWGEQADLCSGSTWSASLGCTGWAEQANLCSGSTWSASLGCTGWARWRTCAAVRRRNRRGASADDRALPRWRARLSHAAGRTSFLHAPHLVGLDCHPPPGPEAEAMHRHQVVLSRPGASIRRPVRDGP